MQIKDQVFKVGALKNQIKNSNGITFQQVKVEYKNHKYNAWKVFDKATPIFTMCGAGRENYYPLILHTEHGGTTYIELAESVASDFWNFLEADLVQIPQKQKSKSNSR